MKTFSSDTLKWMEKKCFDKKVSSESCHDSPKIIFLIESRRVDSIAYARINVSTQLVVTVADVRIARISVLRWAVTLELVEPIEGRIAHSASKWRTVVVWWITKTAELISKPAEVAPKLRCCDCYTQQAEQNQKLWDLMHVSVFIFATKSDFASDHFDFLTATDLKPNKYYLYAVAMFSVEILNLRLIRPTYLEAAINNNVKGQPCLIKNKSRRVRLEAFKIIPSRFQNVLSNFVFILRFRAITVKDDWSNAFLWIIEIIQDD